MVDLWKHGERVGLLWDEADEAMVRRGAGFSTSNGFLGGRYPFCGPFALVHNDSFSSYDVASWMIQHGPFAHR